jgi:uncharacterized membrane protein YfhO
MAIRDIVSPSNRPGYRGEQYLLGAGSLRLATWSPEILVYDVDVKSPTVLEINQNYDTSWKVHRGRGEVFSDNGLLAVRLSAGAQQIELRYRSDAFVAGLLIALAAFLLALLVTTYEVRARRAHSPSVSE